MSKQSIQNLTCEERLKSVLKLAGNPVTIENLRDCCAELEQVVDVATQAEETELSEGAHLSLRLLELANCWDSISGTDESREELIEFVTGLVEQLIIVSVEGDDEQTIDSFIEQAESNWNDYLVLIDDQIGTDDGWNPNQEALDFDEDEEVDDEELNPSQGQVELMLAAIETSSSTADAEFSCEDYTHPVLDQELLEAYLDDANRCLGSMEQAALALEASPDDKESIPQFCRELHTLKGASATVGLSELASYLHDLESALEKMFAEESETPNVEPLFEAVDRVRSDIANLVATNPDSPKSNDMETASTNPNRSTNELADYAANDNSSIRIRAAKLDRLMDMLAELVVLRNRRESHVSDFEVLNGELSVCASRLNFLDKQTVEVGVGAQRVQHPARFGSNTLSEVAKDIDVVFNGLRDLQQPLSRDNTAISRFIRDFRQELMQLRRIPVSGLFHRLQRAARDAAKQEHKQVQVKLIGQDSGLEQEIQERLFEPLLHIVRNAVSHGFETELTRKQQGKNGPGSLTLEAYSSTQLFVIEVRDDGNGIDFDAIRRRAIERGLLTAGQVPSRSELANMIFHSGFSTRQEASEVSGRGVGMNVVATTMDHLRGRIEVDSEPGQGTTMRLLIPLRTGIEHVMVFRCNRQLFALPMQSVTAAKNSSVNARGVARLSLATASAHRNKDSRCEDVLLLKCAADQNSTRPMTTVALAVDELIGPEEVVMRGLPNLLRGHPLFNGVTLSGAGEPVLLLNADRILDFSDQAESFDHDLQTTTQPGKEVSNQKRALVVDDSLTARRALVKLLHKHDFTTVEAGDGVEAIERLHRESFDLVLTDLDMPRLGGLELLSDIQSGHFCSAPVAVVSSREEETFRAKAMDFGAIEYVSKPVSEATIAQLLETLELLPAISQG